MAGAPAAKGTVKMQVERLTIPASRAVTTADAKDYMRVDLADEDALIDELIESAEQEIEQYAGIALLTQTARATYQGWPDLNTSCLSLPVGPVQDDATVSVTVDGVAFTAFTLSAGRYPALTFTEFDLAVLADALIVVDYSAGWGDAGTAVPPDLLTAVKEQVLRLYDMRGGLGLARHQSAMSPHAQRLAQR